jgi:DNA-binding NtrC family response regulator
MVMFCDSFDAHRMCGLLDRPVLPRSFLVPSLPVCSCSCTVRKKTSLVPNVSTLVADKLCMTHPHAFTTTCAAPTPAQCNTEVALTMLGPSAAMAHLWLQVRRLAPHVRNVLLTGLPHCGQEAVARLLLDFSAAPKRNFVQVSAADANIYCSRHSGFVPLPADVVLFIPDLDRFSLASAESLLQIMRMRRSRLFTVVAATSRDLHALAAAGRFPNDLAHALSSVRLDMPELKQRREDIPMLLGHLLAVRASESCSASHTMSADFLHAAMEYAWPGNLQELSHVASSLVENATDGLELSASDFTRVVEIPQTAPAIAAAQQVRMISLDDVMQEHLSSVLRACRGNKVRAAEVLGISRSTLYRMLNAAPIQSSALCGAGSRQHS